MTGAPDRNRTCDLQIRNLSLYPTELRALAMFTGLFKLKHVERIHENFGFYQKSNIILRLA